MNIDICGNCKFFDKTKLFNNCKANIVGKVQEQELGCYKIQFNKIKTH